MLILGGSNLVDDDSIQLNWLSYASVWAVETMQESGHILAAFCQTDYTLTKGTRGKFVDIMQSLIYQLAEKHPSGLRSRREETSEALHSPLWCHSNPLVAYEKMTQTLSMRIAGFEDGTNITIVIDRLDRCAWSNEHVAARVALDAAISFLLALVQDESLHHLRVKVLLVMDAIPAMRVAKRLEWGRRHGALQYKVDWDQEAAEE
jgi:hypothetical protein